MLPADRKPKQEEILAAQKILADISSGIYRSPAAALKELISNAYDADATRVTITTDAPNFRILTIQDNGIGMTIEKFKNVIHHIGGSSKRIDGDISSRGRKLIGRIGIGMLAVAQMSNHFYVSSSVKGQSTRFIAEVNLEPFHKDDIALRSMGKIKDEGQVHIGAVKYVDDIPEKDNVQYTVITVPDAKKGLISEINSSLRKKVGAKERLSIEKKNISDFDELIEVVRASKRADLDLDGYYYMLWELALLCPLNYSRRGLFETSKRKIENREDFRFEAIKDFKIEVDGIELFRPQVFPNICAIHYPSPNPKVYALEYDSEIAGRRLKFHGYIYNQQPRIDPEELKGIHIRIRNVGIGKYDKSCLGYPFDESIRFGQISGEIYVDEGLEPALNIDRDSFRETDVHYQAMRMHIWEVLQTEVFPGIKSRAADFRQKKRNKIQRVQIEKFTEAVLQLPAPLVDTAEIKRDITPSISDWIEVDESKLIIDKAKWDEFAEKNDVSKNETRDRFLRVLSVLVSSELLTDLTQDEVNTLLQALALAVR